MIKREALSARSLKCSTLAKTPKKSKIERKKRFRHSRNISAEIFLDAPVTINIVSEVVRTEGVKKKREKSKTQVRASGHPADNELST